MENTTEKRVVKKQESKGLSLKDIILVAVLLAAGAVLKFFVGSVINFGGMKPNFIIAMYCLAIMLIKPKLHESAIIGIIAGITCQFFPGTPYINIISETVGAIAMGLLLKLPLKFEKFDLRPTVCTFLSTLFSGFTYLGMLYVMLYAGADVQPAALGVFAAIIFGTALINTIIVTVLYVPLKLAFKKD
ncbi:MAG: tryptophan transporter [Huintestinicola sp.]